MYELKKNAILYLIMSHTIETAYKKCNHLWIWNSSPPFMTASQAKKQRLKRLFSTIRSWFWWFFSGILIWEQISHRRQRPPFETFLSILWLLFLTSDSISLRVYCITLSVADYFVCARCDLFCKPPHSQTTCYEVISAFLIAYIRSVACVPFLVFTLN